MMLLGVRDLSLRNTGQRRPRRKYRRRRCVERPANEPSGRRARQSTNERHAALRISSRSMRPGMRMFADARGSLLFVRTMATLVSLAASHRARGARDQQPIVGPL